MQSEQNVLTSFSLEEIATLKSSVMEGAPFAARVSFGMTLRLIGHPRETAAVLQAIRVLEGSSPAISNKQRARQFQHHPLHPLWHAHFINSRHVLRNIGDQWGISRDGKGNPRLDAAISHVAKSSGHDPDAWQSEIVKRFIAGGLFDRADSSKLSGDWIIFARHEGVSYYLDIAQHEEGEGEEKSMRLIEKLRASSEVDFPFIFSPSGGAIDLSRAAPT